MTIDRREKIAELKKQLILVHKKIEEQLSELSYICDDEWTEGKTAEGISLDSCQTALADALYSLEEIDKALGEIAQGAN